MTKEKRILEKSIATASFIVAVVLTFISLFISEEHDIASNVLFVIAQFLTLTATLLGIDYKFTADGKFNTARHSQQQSSESSNLV